MADILGQIFGEWMRIQRRMVAAVCLWCRVLRPTLSGSFNAYFWEITPFGRPETTGAMAFGARTTSTEGNRYAA